MKYFYFITLFIVAIANANDLKINADNNIITERYEVNELKSIQLVNNINKLIQHNNGGHVAKRFLYVKEKIDNGKLLILTRHNNINFDIRNAACFYPPNTEGYNEKIPAIALSSYLYDLFEKHPSLTYAIVVHEICHAYDYFINNDEFMLYYTGNEFEGYMYEMDAIYLETMFINDFIDTTEYTLTSFEKYLSRCYKKRDLNSVSITFKNLDNNVSRRLYELSSSELDFENALKSLYNVGDSLKSAFCFPVNGSLRDKYLAIIPIFTYCRFGPQSIRDIDHCKNKSKMKTSFSIEKYPSNFDILQELSKIISPYKVYIDLYNAHVDSIFFKDI